MHYKTQMQLYSMMTLHYYSSTHIIWYRYNSHTFSRLLYILSPHYTFLTSSRDILAGAVTEVRTGQVKIEPDRPDRLSSRPDVVFSGIGKSFTGELSVREADHPTVSSVGVKTEYGFWMYTCILVYALDCLTLGHSVYIGTVTYLCILIVQWPQSRIM